MSSAPRVFAAATAFLLLSLPVLAAAEPTPLRMASSAFGRRAEVEVRDLPAPANAQAIQTALDELAAAAVEADPQRAPLAQLAENQQPVHLSPTLLDLLVRATAYCQWTDGRIGPTGGRLAEIWGLERPVTALPAEAAIAAARASAACDRLRLDPPKALAALATGSRLDFHNFAIGWAVDRAVAALVAAGAHNAFVEVGDVKRGIGSGPKGRGWIVEPGRFPGQSSALSAISLVDRAFAVARGERSLAIAGERFPRSLDLRTGQPTAAGLAVLVVTELAVDAQALSAVLLLESPSQGGLLLGSAKPSPSVLWLLGSGEAEPLLDSSQWSVVRAH